MNKVTHFLQLPIALGAYTIGFVSSQLSTFFGNGQWDNNSNSLVYAGQAERPGRVISLPEIKIDSTGTLPQ